MIRYLTAGESHGRAVIVIIEGLPAGLDLRAGEIEGELARRRLGFGRGPRMRVERDEVTIIGGVRHGRTRGAPVAIQVANSEWPKWSTAMDPAPPAAEAATVSSAGVGGIVPGTSTVNAAPLTQPRPGHADLAGMQKYGLSDARDVLERASARETAARVAAGTCAKAFLARLGIDVISHVVQLGAVEAKSTIRPEPSDLERIDQSEVRCFDADAEGAMVAEIKTAAKAGDSLGGVAEVLAYGVPVGLGSHVHWDRRLDGLLAGALMSIHAVKGVEIGDGFDLAGRRGSEAHDEILWESGEAAYKRPSVHAGGIEGGMSVGGLVVARAAMKPLATLNRPVLRTVDTETKEETVSFKERTDVTAVPAMGVVAETMVALVLADESLRKFGGDSIDEVLRNRDGFLASLH